MSSQAETLDRLAQALDRFQWYAAEEAAAALAKDGVPHAQAVAIWIQAMHALDRGEVGDAIHLLQEVRVPGKLETWSRESAELLDADSRRSARDPVAHRLLEAVLLYGSVSVRLTQDQLANAVTRSRLAVERVAEAAQVGTRPDLPDYTRPCLGVPVTLRFDADSMEGLSEEIRSFLARSEGSYEIFPRRKIGRPNVSKLVSELGGIFNGALGGFPPSAGAPFGYGDLRAASHHALTLLSHLED